MLKYVVLLKRREGMSFEDFVDYYRTKHSRLRGTIPGGKSWATRTQRQFLRPVEHSIQDPSAGVDYDCVMERWFPDRAALDAHMAFLARPEVRELYVADEERLFDRRYTRCYIVDEEFTLDS